MYNAICDRVVRPDPTSAAPEFEAYRSRVKASLPFIPLWSRRQSEHHDRVPGRDRDVLVTAGLIGDRIGPDLAAGLKSPQRLARLGIERDEHAFHRARKDQSSRSREQTAPRRRGELELPFHIA